MSHINILPDNKTVEIHADETILHASLQAGIPHTHACGGHARCSTCRCLIVDGLEHCAPRNESEQKMADKLNLTPEIRLACQTRVTGNVNIRRLALDAEDVTLIKEDTSTAEPVSVGEEKRIAILFSDIRGFTSFSEGLPAYDVIHVLNRYFHDMGEVVARNGGCIDNYIGDGLMVLFGVHDPQDAAKKAVKAGVEMLEAVERFAPYLMNLYGVSFRIGIGVHAGEAVVGSIGTGRSRRITAIGDAVNFASRIESANKKANTSFLISEQTYAEVKEFVTVNPAVRLTLPGKSGEYTLYEVTAFKGP